MICNSNYKGIFTAEDAEDAKDCFDNVLDGLLRHDIQTQGVN